MRDTISRLSSEMLEQQIAKVYWETHRDLPGVTIVETGLLADLWAEFDKRLEEGRIDPDTDYEAPAWREGYYE